MKRLTRLLPCGLASVLWSLLCPLAVTAAVRSTPRARPLVAATPWMGWNTWYSYDDFYDEATIHRVAAKLLDDGLAAHGYRLVWLDAGWWQGARNANGTIRVSHAQWPHGMKALAAYLHHRGLKAGIYTDAGRDGCGEPGAGSLDHMHKDVDTFAAWGFDAVKVDFCGGEALHLSPARVYAAFARTMQSSAKARNMVLDICDAYAPQTSWRYAPAIAQGWRTGHDIAFGDFQPAWEGQLNGAAGTYGSVLSNLDLDAAHPSVAGPGHWNDPDYLQAGASSLTAVEQQSQFGMWAMLAAPLMLGRDPDDLSPTTLTMLENSEVIAVDQDRLGIQGRKVFDRAGAQVWYRPLSSRGTGAVALFNRGSGTRTVTVRWRSIGLRGAVHVRDLWRRRYLGSYPSAFTAVVRGHSALLLKVREQPGAR